jgi:hypothetical protein
MLERFSIVGRKIQSKMLKLDPEHQSLLNKGLRLPPINSEQRAREEELDRSRAVFQLSNLRVTKEQVSVLQIVSRNSLAFSTLLSRVDLSSPSIARCPFHGRISSLATLLRTSPLAGHHKCEVSHFSF